MTNSCNLRGWCNVNIYFENILFLIYDANKILIKSILIKQKDLTCFRNTWEYDSLAIGRCTLGITEARATVT